MVETDNADKYYKAAGAARPAQDNPPYLDPEPAFDLDNSIRSPLADTKVHPHRHAPAFGENCPCRGQQVL